MTPITWLFCLAALWAIAVDTQVDAVQPLVMVVYVQEDVRKEEMSSAWPWAVSDKNSTRITMLTDTDNLELALGDTQPKYIVLLCPDTEEDSKKSKFTIKQVINNINSRDTTFTCKYLAEPSVELTRVVLGKPILCSIGLNFTVPQDKLSNEKLKEEDTLLYEFMNEFNICSQFPRKKDTYLTVEYDFKHNIPESISHTVRAHMHSNDYEKECEKIYILDEGNRYRETSEHLAAKFKSEQVPADHQWRQLVPIQDFKDIYQTQATCAYLNYLLLHKNAIESLKEIETYIREVADVTNAVHVTTKTYIEEDKDAATKPDENGDTISIYVFKEITHELKGKRYGVRVIIHNKAFKRYCEPKENWGWPGQNYSEENIIQIGAMYYCAMAGYDDFNLNEIHPHLFSFNSYGKMIKTQESSRQTEGKLRT